MTLKYIWRSFSLGCHFHVHFSYPWHAFASHGLPAIAELLVKILSRHTQQKKLKLEKALIGRNLRQAARHTGSRVTWRHRARGHLIPKCHFLYMNAPLKRSLYFQSFWRHWAKHIGVMIFDLSGPHDHSFHHMPFPIGWSIGTKTKPIFSIYPAPVQHVNEHTSTYQTNEQTNMTDHSISWRIEVAYWRLQHVDFNMSNVSLHCQITASFVAYRPTALIFYIKVLEGSVATCLRRIVILSF